ncbi:MAG: hypothetical protein N4A49_03215 [Marinifilaceae bacterium]|jgi:hypothetical protein|nr:hypothetical protein [Marinifilaceae bacterium]
MKKTIILFLTIISFLTGYAQDKKVAMLSTKALTDNVSKLVLNMIRGELTKSICKENGFTAYTRTDIDKIVEEITFQTEGFIPKAECTKLGKMSGADFICMSKVSREGNAYYIEAALIDLLTGKIENPATGFVETDKISGLNEICKKIAKELIGYTQNNEFSKSVKINVNDRVKIAMYTLKTFAKESTMSVSMKINEKLNDLYKINHINKTTFRTFTRQPELYKFDNDYCLELRVFDNMLRLSVYQKSVGEIGKIVKTYPENQKPEKEFVDKEVKNIISSVISYIPDKK